MRSALLLAVSLLSQVAQAQSVYTWEDANGQHFTNDPSTIPKGAVVRTTQGADISRVSMGKPAEQNDAKDAKAAATAPAVVAPPPSDEPAAPSQAELTWRKLFRDLHNRIAELEVQIEIDRKQVEEVNGLPINGSVTCVPITVAPNGYGYGRGPAPDPRSVQPGYAQPGCAWVQNPEYQRGKDRLEQNRRALERAKVELEDLERRAGWESVPREWRK